MKLFGRDGKPKPSAETVRPLGACEATKRGKAVIGTQVPQGISDLVDAKVAAGEFRSRSDFTLSAIRYYLEHLDVKRK